MGSKYTPDNVLKLVLKHPLDQILRVLFVGFNSLMTGAYFGSKNNERWLSQVGQGNGFAGVSHICVDMIKWCMSPCGTSTHFGGILEVLFVSCSDLSPWQQ